MFSRSKNPLLTFLLSYHIADLENLGQLPAQQVLMIVSGRFSQLLHYLCFWGQGIHCWHSYWAAMFGWIQKFRSTSGTRGTWRYWWLCLINFWNMFTIYVFEVKAFISDIPTELPRSGDLKNPGQLPFQEVLKNTDWWLCLMTFHNCPCINVF